MLEPDLAVQLQGIHGGHSVLWLDQYNHRRDLDPGAAVAGCSDGNVSVGLTTLPVVAD